MKPLKIFIGYDFVESVAFHVLVHSIQSRSSIPISIIPVDLYNFQTFYKRPRDPKQSNEFSFSRFLVPSLCDYDGWALFLDCDMMFRTDVAELLEYMEDDSYAIRVVKHDYDPANTIKYLGTVQHPYPRKNWSSVVLWNCAHPANRVVTPEFVETKTGLELHRFTWLKDEDIGDLPVEWNWLVGEYVLTPEMQKEVKNVHWTVGGPYFHEYSHVDFSEEWFEEKSLMLNCNQRTKRELYESR